MKNKNFTFSYFTKLTSLLLLLTMGIGQVWATITPKTISDSDGEVYMVTPATLYDYYNGGNGWVTNASGGEISSNSYYSSKTGGNNTQYIIPETEATATSNTQASGITLKTADNRSVRFYFTGAVKVTAFIASTGSSRTATITVYKVSDNSEVGHTTGTNYSASGPYEKLEVTGLSASVSYYAKVTATNDLCLYAMKFFAASSGGSTVPVTGITIAPASKTIKVGRTVTLAATVTPNTATDKAVTWAVTSGSSYASVNASGVVTGLAAGTATITATAHDGSGVTQTATITVEECATSGTMYKFQVATGLTNGNIASSVPSDISATTENYLSALVGGELTIAARNNVNRVQIVNTNAIGFANGADAFLEMKLDCDIEAGDIIKYTIASNNMELMAGSATESTNKMTLDRTKTQVEVDSKLVGASALYMKRSSSSPNISYFEIYRPLYRTITLEYADGATPDGSLDVIDGTAATKPADPTWAHHRFDGWYNGASPYDWTATVSGDLTLTAHWTQLYTVTYAKGDEGATGDAPTQADKAATETFKVAANTFELAGKVFDHWNDGTADYNPEDTYTVGTSNVTLTAVWRTPSTMYAITKGTHTNGDFTISPAEQEAGGTVTLVATPDEDYLFDAWEVVKTEDASATGITVDANGQFEMPAYGVTVNATFVADTRKKVLYLTTASTENDKLYAALKDDYNLAVAAPGSQTLTDYDLIVLHESIGGSVAGSDGPVKDAATTSVPVLNTKTYFYNSGRWNWGTPNNGQAAQKVATLNSGYCNIADHPIFSGVTISAGEVTVLTNDATGNTMQPVAPSSGKEGYLLATTPNASSGVGYAIQEIPAGDFRGATSGKYILISVSNAGLNNLTADGQKLFQNAAAYLIDGSVHWTPVVAPTSPEIAGTTAYSTGATIELTASATGTSASTTYTWYKGDTWAEAEAAGAIQAAETAANNGNVYSKAICVVGDAGTYWCVIANGVGCTVSASQEITVSDESYDITFVSAHGTAPTATNGVTYDLPELTESGWVHQGWTASVDVIVDAEEVTAGTLIANGKTASFSANVEFTAVWAQVFEVTFNMKGHGAAIAKQDVLDGGKASEPADPVAIGWIFGGWFTDTDCTAGNEYDFNTTITENKELFAKWTEFTGCTELWPATSGDAPAAVGDEIVMQTGSKGATMTALAKPENLTYTASGLQFGTGSGTKASVVLGYDMSAAEGTQIQLTLVAAGTGTRGLTLHKANGDKINAFTCWVDGTNPASNGAEATFTYTVQAGDGLDGANEFQLARNNTVILKSLKVVNCGAAIIYHDLTSAVDPAGKGTVTLGASSVREGYTTTAEYSAIDAAYEFDEWQISGTDATITDASANPAVITMGTADAVVTLKLKAATPKHTVSYNVMGHGVAPANEEVKEGAKVTKPADPTAEDWAFLGWYKENTLDNAWDFDVDVMGTENITLYAKWLDETSAIKLVGTTGAINTTDFTTGVTAGTVNFDEADHNCAEYGHAITDVISCQYLDGVVQYNATKTQLKVKLDFYCTSTSKNAYLFTMLENGHIETLETIEMPTIGRYTTEYITFNNAARRSIYVTVSDKKVKILQVKVIESGDDLLQFGEAGYSLNLNKSRLLAPTDATVNFEGMTVTPAAHNKVDYSENLSLKSDKDPISFTLTAPVTMTIVNGSSNKYYVSTSSTGSGTEYGNGSNVFDLTAGAWYIVPKTTSAVQLTNITFSAPKCAEPAFNSLANSELCEGDPFAALDGTATVADAGVPTYQWYNADGDIEIDGATSATYTPTADGSYYVIATNHLAGYSDNEKKSATVTVEHFASAQITTAPKNVRDDAGNEFTLTVAATGKNLSYEWFTCNEDGTGAVAVDPACTTTSFTANVPTVTTYYKVVVSSDCGNVEAIAKVEPWVDFVQVNVSENTSWDFTTCADAEIKLTDATTPKKGMECLMANIRVNGGVHYDDPAFNAQALIFAGEYIYRNVAGKPLGAVRLKFTTTVDGFVTVRFADNGNNNRCLRVTDSEGVEYSQLSASNSDIQEFTTFVHAGEIEIMGMKEDHTGENQYVRIFNLAFEKVNYSRAVNAGRYGTICLPNGGVMKGADLFEVAYYGATSEKIFFDQIVSGEMVAGTPYIFLPKEGYKYLGVEYTDAANAEARQNVNGLYGFIGASADEYYTIPDGVGYYILQNNQYREVQAGANARVQSNRAYIKLGEISPSEPALSPGRRRVAIGPQAPQTPTGFEGVQDSEVSVQKIMIDGELFILRGEKMYDATGRLVK